MLNRLRAQESGLTLIELLIAIAISGLILGAVVTGFLVTMAGSQNVHERFVSSHDAQLLSTYFPTDVQSANPDMINPTTPGCGGTMLGTQIIRLDWTENESATTSFSASYRLESSTSGSTLRRYFCSGTNLAAQTATSSRVASNLADPAVQLPTEINLANLPRIDLTLYSYRTQNEIRAGIPVYSYKFSSHIRTPSSTSSSSTSSSTSTSTSTSTTSTSSTTTTTTAPDTTPPPNPSVSGVKTKNNEVSVTFSDTEAGVTFECAVDSGTFSSCTSPTEYKGPAYDGVHQYRVRAVDAAENRSATVSVSVDA